MTITGKFIDMAHHFMLRRFHPLDLSLKLRGRNGAFSTLCNSCEFACQKTVLKTFHGTGYLHSKDGVV